MKFTASGLIYIGVKRGVSENTEKKYCIVEFLTHENEVIRCFAENEIDIEGINKFDEVQVEFRLRIGKQYRLTVLDIRKS